MKRRIQKETAQERTKNTTELRILSVLDTGPLRWNELLDKTGLSTRTLSDRIKELQKKDLVKRSVDNKVYPPAVSYELTRTATLMAKYPAEFVYFSPMMIHNIMDYRKCFAWHLSNKDPVTAAKHMLDFTIRDYVFDLTRTLSWCSEFPTKKDLFLYQHEILYQTKITDLVDYINQDKNMQRAAEEQYKEYIDLLDAQSKENIDAIMNRHEFKDKELARAIILVHSKSMFDKETGKVFDLAKQAKTDMKLRVEIEQILGSKFDEKRLDALLKENEWATLQI